jgi:hypothetical protein
MKGSSAVMTFRVESIKICWMVLRLLTMALVVTTGIEQASAHAGPSLSSTAFGACVSKALGVGRVVSSSSECRQDENFVTVNETREQALATPPLAIRASVPAEHMGPGMAAMTLSLNVYRDVSAQASGRGRRDCQSFLSSKYQGRLQDLAQAWCDAAKRFEASEQGCQLSGSREAPTLTCAETLTVYPKDGDPKQYRSQKTFHLSGEPDGTWQISGW